MHLAIIGGSGLYQLGEETSGVERVSTHYGEVLVRPTQLCGREVYFLPRHGANHSLPPHRINYLANVAALKQLGCTAIIATNAVGALRRDLNVGMFVVPDQLIDFTKQRPLTFYNGGDAEGVKHADLTEPYCPNLRRWLVESAVQVGQVCADTGTYLCAEGPRFETAAEVRLFAQWGGDVVGMTGVPEVVLARELGLCYASLCLVTNLGAGLAPEPPSHREVNELMERRLEALRAVLISAIARTEDTPDCRCRQPFG